MSDQHPMNISEERENRERIDESISERKYSYSLSLAPYFLLVGLRVVLTLTPQIGYIQPDEYFQSVEIVNEDLFGVEASRPWEFNVTKPIRSVTLPYLYVGLPMFILKCAAHYTKHWFHLDILTPYFLITIPRISCCLLSFLNDWSLYKICQIYGQNYRSRLLTLASSYVILIYGTHTFSNTIEMTLMSVLLYYVANSMYKSDQIIEQDEWLEQCYLKTGSMKEKVRLNRLRKALPGHSFSSCLVIASIAVLGVFNRPTFLAFAFTPVFFWLHRGLGSKHVGLAEFHKRIIILGLSAVPMTVFLILVDSFYFGYLTVSEILEKQIYLEHNFVVTPYNFIQYNAYTSNLANHGLHPRATHLLFNVPLLYNVLGVAAILSTFNWIYRVLRQQWSILPRIQSIIGLMMAACAVPVALLSIFPHQEPRFLIPVTLPMVFLHSQKIRNVNELHPVYEQYDKGVKVFMKKSSSRGYKDKLLTVWYLINIVLVFLYGFVHQAGVYPLMDHFSAVMKEKPRLMTIHLVTSFVYPLPISLLQLQRKKITMTKNNKRFQPAKDFFTYEMGLSDTVENATNEGKRVVDMLEQTWNEKRLQYKVFLAIPTSRYTEFQSIANKKNITYSLEHIFYPHLSTEVMPNFSLDIINICEYYNAVSVCPGDKELSIKSSLKYFTNIISQFGLALIRLNK